MTSTIARGSETHTHAVIVLGMEDPNAEQPVDMAATWRPSTPRLMCRVLGSLTQKSFGAEPHRSCLPVGGSRRRSMFVNVLLLSIVKPHQSLDCFDHALGVTNEIAVSLRGS